MSSLGLKEKEWKHEIGKAWKHTLSCCVCVPHLLQEEEHKEYIYVRISSKKLGFPTQLFQKTKLGSTISSIVPSFLHSRKIFSFILAIGPNGHNSNWNYNFSFLNCNVRLKTIATPFLQTLVSTLRNDI